MTRVSTGMMNNDIQNNLRLQESRQNRINGQLSSQQRLQSLREDPLAAGHLVRYQSYLGRVQTFEKNAQVLTDRFSLTEGYMDQSLEIMHRVRELAVAGATGTYTPDDLKNMASEVDELLEELVQNANATGPDGNSLFAGTRTNRQAFDVEMGTVAGSGSPKITQVRYNGNVDINKIEVDEGAYLETQSAGNRIFWSQPQELYSMRDASSYRVAEDGVISVDGREIRLSAGDNVYSIVAKINDSGAAVKASIDPVSFGLNLQTTDSRQLWLQDLSGTVLQDLGLIKDASQHPPYNISDNVQLSGGSLFDSVIALRDAMLTGDQEAIGGRVLGEIDGSVNNLVSRLAQTGAEYERAVQNISRNSATALNVTSMISREGDLDFTKAVTDMKMMDYVREATLSTAGKLYSSSLLDYMN
ncbi:MAG: flagellar hook-associated protein 3 [Candidatus Treponema excrementipullorum]|uniref:Flagellar hook-associated protein 3 n=1 Tax=Candidatus Treponema excrementipullorum TaxID=2838768 RepID=A0A9E2L1F9_9SPIR|nr:flagellar hook-associated protein 3 [Candidatus Treponema excrementipullorum]MCI7589064.1 flagellar hook-associated protein 3 [Spirochaetia bacterium]MDD7012230.1 flagellar hook-associated protein 3 [Candidatus Treponema excrementipullorum]MDY4464787.1 flagellar hook-associated protein 3 [Candidatus Treponema excrementipullorum]MDY4707871.1 flagellar hook-associated protein 3 [Candidatus Treponema excrementipullorum]